MQVVEVFAIVCGFAAHEDVVMFQHLVEAQLVVHVVVSRAEQVVHLVVSDLAVGREGEGVKLRPRDDN